LLLHKLRSFLTILGVVFGVASVVSMLAIGEGLSRNARDQLLRFGPDRLVIRSTQPANSTASGGDILIYGVTQQDLDRIQRLVPNLASIAGTYEIDKREFWAGERVAEVRVVGTTPAFADIHRLEIASGRFLAMPDEDQAADVVVLGAAAAKRLFAHHEPLGQSIKSTSGYFKVVGVLVEHGEQSSMEYDPNEAIYVPFTTVKARFENVARIVEGGAKRYEKLDLHQIGLRASDVHYMPEIANMVRKLIATTHRKQDYQLMVPFELLRQMDRTKKVFNAVLGSIAGISLLVGGIGIMNIMLASVMERTREIGIRRALGARRRSIIAQFVTESMLLSTVGGLIGIGVGVCIPAIVTRIANVQTVITPWAIALPLGISVLTGVMFGVYPARRAACMQPVEALRHT
ncbi:MAG: ABC transporter permease, partial [Planctomycetales bacterium]|nr:ABC transporter permease [Planctomycetales bacterium]